MDFEDEKEDLTSCYNELRGLKEKISSATDLEIEEINEEKRKINARIEEIKRKYNKKRKDNREPFKRNAVDISYQDERAVYSSTHNSIWKLLEEYWQKDLSVCVNFGETYYSVDVPDHFEREIGMKQIDPESVVMDALKSGITEAEIQHAQNGARGEKRSDDLNR